VCVDVDAPGWAPAHDRYWGAHCRGERPQGGDPMFRASAAAWGSPAWHSQGSGAGYGAPLALPTSLPCSG